MLEAETTVSEDGREMEELCTIQFPISCADSGDASSSKW